MRYAVAHTTYALAHTSGKRGKRIQGPARVLASIHAPLIAAAPQGAVSARQGTPARACARWQPAACGVEKTLPQGSGNDLVLRTPFPVRRPLSQWAAARVALERQQRQCRRCDHRIATSSPRERNRAASGFLGERSVRLALLLEFPDAVVLPDLLLPQGSGTAQIDLVVETRGALYVAEVKTWDTAVGAAGDGGPWTVRYTRRDARLVECPFGRRNAIAEP